MEQSRTETVDTGWRKMIRVGGISSWMQLGCVIGMTIALAALGMRPETAEEAFTIFQSSKLVGLLRDDLFSLLIVAFYLGTFTGIYAVYRKTSHQAYVTLLTVLVFITVILTFANHSAFSLMHLSDQYAAATSEAQRSQLIAAGEAVFASNIWYSTGAYIGGILLQGSGILISVLMLRHKGISKVTAIAGIIANAGDLAQHLLSPFAPSIAGTIGMFGFPFYLVWFPMLGLNLLKLGRTPKETEAE
ncbi:MAG: DUF4386 family protein [Anaerolineae bacterium]|nr:DUF4386 family protein [Anaerolineae bacterium]